MASKDKMQGRRKTPFELVMMIVATLIGSLFFSILLEWMGMLFLWSEQGVGHSREMILTEISYLHDDLINSTILGVTPKEAVDIVFNFVIGKPFDISLLDYENKIMKPNLNEATQGASVASGDWLAGWGGYLGDWFNYVIFVTQEFLVAAVYISMVALNRIVIVVLSLPLYGVFLITAMIDGLAQRDLRRFGGARESGTRYHFSKASVLPTLLIGWLIYISFPVSINPNYVLLPIGVVFGISVYLTIANYKKYF